MLNRFQAMPRIVPRAKHHTNLNQWLQDWRQGHPGALSDHLERLVALVRGRAGDWRYRDGFVSAHHREAVVDALAALDADEATLAAALVFASCRDLPGIPEAWREALDDETLRLAEGLMRTRGLGAGSAPQARGSTALSGAEGLRRLLLAVVDDVRVVMVILADQLALLRAAASAPEALRREIATENAELYAPLANRLGVWQLKWELEDLAFRYLEPDAYHRIAKLLEERRADRERYIAEVVSRLGRELREAGMDADVAGRPKHIYSIWRKMQRKGVGFHELYDVRAVRVLVDSVGECYAALGIVHSLWQHIPGEFDDYIATPKGNLYRSLHTAVVGPEGKTLEIQIRTREMHEHAELGVAAHWRYKEGKGRDPGYERKINWMRRLLERPGDEELVEAFRSEVAEDRVYVLTPQGQVMDLPSGATVLDFAYHVHTDVGHRCRGAKVNGRIVPLTHRLQTGEQVEILTSKNSEPSRDWMVPVLGYLHTGRARQKVRQWFRKRDYERNREEGREQVERELVRLGLARTPPESVVERFNFRNLDDLYAAVGSGEITPTQVANAAGAGLGDRRGDFVPVAGEARARAPESGDVTIEGVGNLLFSLARCCRPVPRDDIVGYITRGRGVSIHRRDCSNVVRLLREGSPRLIEVSWGERPSAAYPVEVGVTAWDRKGLLHDLSAVLSNEKVRVLSLNSDADAATGRANIRFTLEVSDIGQLSDLLRRVESVPGVTRARRLTA